MSQEQAKSTPTDATLAPVLATEAEETAPSSSSSPTSAAAPAVAASSVTEGAGGALSLSPAARDRLLKLKWSEMTPDELKQRIELLEQQNREALAYVRAHPGGDPPHPQRGNTTRHWTHRCVILIVVLLSFCFVPKMAVDAIPMRFDASPLLMVPSAPTTILTPPVDTSSLIDRMSKRRCNMTYTNSIGVDGQAQNERQKD